MAEQRQSSEGVSGPKGDRFLRDWYRHRRDLATFHRASMGSNTGSANHEASQAYDKVANKTIAHSHMRSSGG